MRNFITSFDYENDKISLVKNPNAPDAATISDAHVSNGDSGMSGWGIFFIIAFVLVVLAIAGWFIFKWCKKNKQKEALTIAYRENGPVKISTDISEGTPKKGGQYKNHWATKTYKEEETLL